MRATVHYPGWCPTEPKYRTVLFNRMAGKNRGNGSNGIRRHRRSTPISGRSCHVSSFSHAAAGPDYSPPDKAILARPYFTSCGHEGWKCSLITSTGSRTVRWFRATVKSAGRRCCAHQYVFVAGLISPCVRRKRRYRAAQLAFIILDTAASFGLNMVTFIFMILTAFRCRRRRPGLCLRS